MDSHALLRKKRKKRESNVGFLNSSKLVRRHNDGACVEMAEWNEWSEFKRKEWATTPDYFLPVKFKGARLRDFDDANEAIVGACSRWAYCEEATTGLYIYGKVGIGKSHLLAASIAEYAMNGGTPAWMSEWDFLSRIDYSMQSGPERRDFWNYILGRECVVLDDLFSTRMNDWKIEGLTKLIHICYDMGITLCATSNRADPGEFLPETAASRLSEMTQKLAMFGKDLRREK